MIRAKQRVKTGKAPYQIAEGEVDLKKSHTLAKDTKNYLSDNLNQLSDVYNDLRYDIYNRAKNHTTKLKDYNSKMKNKIESIMRTEKVYNKRLNAINYSPQADYDKVYKSIVLNEDDNASNYEKIPNLHYNSILMSSKKSANISQISHRSKFDGSRTMESAHTDKKKWRNSEKRVERSDEFVETSELNAITTIDESFYSTRAKHLNTSIFQRQKVEMARRIRSESADNKFMIRKHNEIYDKNAVNIREKRKFDINMSKVALDRMQYKKLSNKYKNLISNQNNVKGTIKKNTKAFEKNTFEKTAQMNHLSLTKSYYQRVLNDKKIEQLLYTPDISTTATNKATNVYENEMQIKDFHKVIPHDNPGKKPYYMNVLKKKGSSLINTDNILTGAELEQQVGNLKGDDQSDDDESNLKVIFINRTHAKLKFHTIDSDNARWDMFKLKNGDKKEVLSFLGEQWVIEDKNGPIGSMKLMHVEKTEDTVDQAFAASIIVIIKDYLDKAFSSKHDNFKKGHVSSLSLDQKHKELIKSPIRKELKKTHLKNKKLLDKLPIDYSSILFMEKASEIKDLNPIDKNYVSIYNGGSKAKNGGLVHSIVGTSNINETIDKTMELDEELINDLTDK